MTSLKTGLLIAALALPGIAFADQNTSRNDNTARNAERQVTADQQSNSSRDLEITRKIRADLVANKNLSTYAKNIKVVTQGGTVVLSGPVRSQAEKAEAERIARGVAGATAVTNDLTISRD